MSRLVLLHLFFNIIYSSMRSLVPPYHVLREVLVRPNEKVTNIACLVLSVCIFLHFGLDISYLFLNIVSSVVYVKIGRWSRQPIVGSSRCHKWHLQQLQERYQRSLVANYVVQPKENVSLFISRYFHLKQSFYCWKSWITCKFTPIHVISPYSFSPTRTTQPVVVRMS